MARGAQSPAGSPRRGRASPLARPESTDTLGRRRYSTCRAARPHGSAADDQLSSGCDWSKSKPGSTSQGRSGADSSRSNSAGPPFGLPSGGARKGISTHSRILRATPGSVITYRARIRPAACGAMQRVDLKNPLQEIGPGRAAGPGNSGRDERREASSCVRRNGAAADRSRPKNCGSRQYHDVGAACWTSTEAVARPADPRLRV